MNGRYVLAFAALLIAAPAVEASNDGSKTHKVELGSHGADRQAAYIAAFQRVYAQCVADGGELESVTTEYRGTFGNVAVTVHSAFAKGICRVSP